MDPFSIGFLATLGVASAGLLCWILYILPWRSILRFTAWGAGFSVGIWLSALAINALNEHRLNAQIVVTTPNGAVITFPPRTPEAKINELVTTYFGPDSQPRQGRYRWSADNGFVLQ